jgi:2-dehydropantoate 2-reductase
MINKRVVVVGAGAIGGSTACFVAKAGYDLTLVANREEVAQKIRTEGIKVSGVKGSHAVQIPAVAKVSDLQETFDVAFIATKALALKEAAIALLPFLKEDALVVSMQNGICTDILEEVVGTSRTVGCVVGYGATMVERGHLEITSTGTFIVGKTDGAVSENLSFVGSVLESVFPVQITTNILAELYSKLIVNSCITSLGAVCGIKLGPMMKRTHIRRIFLKVIEEAMAVASAMHIIVPPYGGKLDYYGLIKPGIFHSLKSHLMFIVVGWKYKNLKSSSLQSLERSEPTEIDFFNGYIAKKGREVDVKTPVNDRLVAMIKEIEAGKRKISTENLIGLS